MTITDFGVAESVLRAFSGSIASRASSQERGSAKGCILRLGRSTYPANRKWLARILFWGEDVFERLADIGQAFNAGLQFG
ncbi:hypothetical protein EXIGLDRAFT_784806 [Exidia glandulosa HHB12029]|uniref:Uncharacterized protein n=1 Tax=Exidia glandulosa HHB12029 TaxID=1314781 RepID=A0A166M9X9_EXIGL|nr:hypothetical protein EXIGLDRAFT_784806 [Exidia glandulosa HHB12029]